MMRVREWREARGRRETRRPMWRFAEREKAAGTDMRRRALNLFENLSTPRTALKFRVREREIRCRSRSSRHGGASDRSSRDARLRGGGRADAESLFRKSGDEFRGGPLDADEKVSQTDKALVDAHELGDEVRRWTTIGWRDAGSAGGYARQSIAALCAIYFTFRHDCCRAVVFCVLLLQNKFSAHARALGAPVSMSILPGSPFANASTFDAHMSTTRWRDSSRCQPMCGVRITLSRS